MRIPKKNFPGQCFQILLTDKQTDRRTDAQTRRHNSQNSLRHSPSPLLNLISVRNSTSTFDTARLWRILICGFKSEELIGTLIRPPSWLNFVWLIHFPYFCRHF